MILTQEEQKLLYDRFAEAYERKYPSLANGGIPADQQLTQEEINQIVGEGLANGNIPLPNGQTSTLGTMLGFSDTYAGLPTIDQLGNQADTNDFAYLNVDDGAYKKGFYSYLGGQAGWKYLTGGTVDELPTQAELDTVLV